MFFPVHYVDVLLKTKSVNNNRIYRDVDELVMDIIKQDLDALQSVARQLETAELIEEYLNEYAQTEPSLTNFEVICDQRNNSKEDCNDGRVNLAVRYQQLNCLNVTELAYGIKL